jgi:hypothetical protein
MIKLETYGNVTLSIACGYETYSFPMKPDVKFEDCTHYEVGLIVDGHLRRPSQIGLHNEWDRIFDSSDESVAGYVDRYQLDLLRRYLAHTWMKERPEVRVNAKQSLWRWLRSN